MPDHISLGIDSLIQIGAKETVEVEGILHLSPDLDEGDYDVIINALVDDIKIENMSIHVSLNSNLVHNPGFEEGIDSPTSWSMQSASEWEWVQDEVNSGNYALTIFPGPNGRSDVTGEKISVKPNTTYRVTYWAKNDSLNGGSFGIRNINTNNGTIDYVWEDVQRNVDWTEHAFTFEPEAGAEHVAVYLRLQQNAGGQIWFDDIRIEEVIVE